MYVCMQIYVHIHASKRDDPNCDMWKGVYIYMYIFCTYICIHTYVVPYIHASKFDACIHLWCVCVCVNVSFTSHSKTCIRAYQTYIHACKGSCVNTHAYIYMHKYIGIYNTYAHIHTYIHVHMYTHIHTQMYAQRYGTIPVVHATGGLKVWLVYVYMHVCMYKCVY